MSDDLWLAKLFQSSVPLRKLNPERFPVGMASGCLLDYHGKRLLLSVQHATGDQGDWAIELGYEKGYGAKYYRLGAMNFLMQLSLLDLNCKNIDFSYVDTPDNLTAFRQELQFDGTVINQVPIYIYKPDFEIEPDKSNEYGFAGTVLPSLEKHHGKHYFFSELRLYDGLKFLRAENEYYVFKLPFKHPGHEHFEGCSGAPVIDKQGNVCGLICGGKDDKDEIYAISLKKYKVPIDILVGNIQ